MNSWMRSLQTEKTLATTLHGGNQRGHSLCLNNKRIAASSCCCKCAELRNDSSKSLQVGCDQHHCSCHHRSFKFCVGISDCLTSPHCITTLKGVSSQCNSSALRPNRPQGKTCGLFRFIQPQIHIEKRLIQKNLPANWQVSEQIDQPDLDRTGKICSNKFRFLSAKNHHFELVIEG